MSSHITLAADYPVTKGDRLTIHGMGAYRVLKVQGRTVWIRRWRWYDFAWVQGLLGAAGIGLVLLALSLLSGCVLDPLAGDYGVVEVVPKQDSCRVKVRVHDSLGVQRAVRWEWQPCEGEGHEVEVFGRRWP